MIEAMLADKATQSSDPNTVSKSPSSDTPQGSSWASGLSALGPIGSLVGVGIEAYNNKKNLEMQKEQQKYDRELQQTMFKREDSAVQRRAADLKAAGLSQTLAAGGSAQAGPVVKSSAPQGEVPELSQRSQNMLASLQMKEQISNTLAQREYINQQIRAEKNKNELLEHDLKIWRKTPNMLTTASPFMRDVNSFAGMVDANLVAPIGNYIEKQKVEKAKRKEAAEYNKRMRKEKKPGRAW